MPAGMAPGRGRRTTASARGDDMLKVALVQCPAWTAESPNYSLALLGGILKREGFDVQGFDLNLEMYYRCAGTARESSWNMDSSGNSWYLPAFVAELVDETSPLVEDFTGRIIASGARVIGFSVHSTSVHFTNAVSRRLKAKAPDRVVVYGGPQCFRNCAHLSLFDEHPAVDAICLTEAERAFPQFLRQLAETGRLEPVPGIAVRTASGAVPDPGNPEPVSDLDSLPFADYSIFPEGFVRARLGLMTSRGCLLRCRFCNESPQWNRYRTRSAGSIVAEMRHQKSRYPGIGYLHFNDSLINGNMKVLESMCDDLIAQPLGATWGGQALIRPQMTSEVISKMKRAGCSMISYGLESGSDTVLKAMGKPYTSALAERVLSDTHALGIYTIFNIIVGFPGEGEKEYLETRDFVARNRSHASLVSFNTLYVFEGSHLFANYEQYGIVLPGSDRSLEGLGFVESDNPSLEWWTRDRSNTYPIRLERLNGLKALTEDKTLVSYSDGDTRMLAGDAHMKLGDEASALAAYREALEACVEDNKRRLLEERIRRLEAREAARQDAAA
jgi:radical SAM superfamily enzyme YgiQ (UPF0313 family)